MSPKPTRKSPLPPWLPPLKTHLSTPNTSLTSFTLSTSTPAGPRSRTVEFRGFLPTLNLHASAIASLKDQGIGLNPDVYESEMLVVTTDARMEKAKELEGGGGKVEGVFWGREAFVLGAGEDGDRGEERARGAVGRGLLRKGSGDGDGEWTWERQVTMYFANHSPVMRGSFKNPPPGTPRSQAPSNPELKLGQKVEDLRDKVARENFRVVVIRPEEVERLDLKDLANVTRTRWTFVPEADGDTWEGKWEEVDLWP
ncbi:hypothetical protein BO71DRAFT_468870 [Aspergillus ellipticus CBS 707.79]|uniref:Pyridoxamine 5'-phosphate oxidase Alr4036 family FMN-binding domain-containing protein n=1 Tax=Aspergillus ellipticus CBS 707.79 TaxID=1448320 RepID=A0A319EYV2_9EURO|nr:hypothetical protein BO71DRAFT_468870 [Aspergillus ellipticus CBS 707.79]